MGYNPFPNVQQLRDMSVRELYDLVYREFQQVSFAINQVDSVVLVKKNVEPKTKRTGQLEYADGTNWNPGSGAGVYHWDGAAWKFHG